MAFEEEHSVRDPLVASFNSDDEGWEDDRGDCVNDGIAGLGEASNSKREQSEGNQSSGGLRAGTSANINVSGPIPSTLQTQEPITETIAVGSTDSSETNTATTADRTGTTVSLWSRIIGHNNISSAGNGVFGNLDANEEEAPVEPELVFDSDDDLTPSDQPPSYDEASADATPSYWETTILSSSFADEIVVGYMPVGSPLVFAWYLLLTSAFSYVGFLCAYLVHNTHAGRGGAFAGLGITLIQTSFSMTPERYNPPGALPTGYTPANPNSFADGPPIGYKLHPTGQSPTQSSAQPDSHTNLSVIIFIAGIVMMFKGVIDYLLALRMRSLIRQHQNQESQEQESHEQESQEQESHEQESHEHGSQEHGSHEQASHEPLESQTHA